MRHINCYNDKEDESLLDMELIDAVIKYIDLTYKKLIREGIKQINKDIENGEIKYCVRSILINIPWINKIYIIMPNEKVKYFKEYEEIKEKIIYIKDKEFIGFDSASSTVFEFNLWRLKNFGYSAKIIKNTHKALADNLFESEEIYNIILNKYQYPNDCLKSIYRGMNQMIYQEFHLNYIINKYNRTIKHLNTKFFNKFLI